MTESEVIAEFIRVRTTPMRTMIEVKEIDPANEDRLSTRWTLAALLPKSAPKVSLDRALMHILADYRWFGKCDQCSELNPKGWLTDRDGEDYCRECFQAQRQA